MKWHVKFRLACLFVTGGANTLRQGLRSGMLTCMILCTGFLFFSVLESIFGED